MKKANVLLTLGFAAGLVVGGLSLSLARNKAVTVKADATPNATFASLPYGDSFNNTAFNSSYNQVLISYTGTAHGLDDTTGNFAPAVDSDMSLHILLNGTQLASYAGSRVIAWNAQLWFRVVYPKTAIADGEGCTIEVKEGLEIGDSVFNHFTIRLNGSDKWAEYSYSSDVNSSYKKIYSDAYNNGVHVTGYNRLMFVYNGVAHAGSTVSGANLAKFDGLITIDGVDLAAYAGGSTQVAPYTNQVWIQIIYPDTAISAGSILTIKEGTKIGNAVFEQIVFKLNSSLKWEYYLGDNAVNATYNKIYDDSYNNTAFNSSYNQLMFVFTGTAHGNPGVISGDDIHKYDGYITIDGSPLPGGSLLNPWSNQPWINVVYPTTSVSAGSVLTIKEGTKIGNTVFEKMVFKLNDSLKWEKLKLIADDPLVKDSDYMLFTPSDFGLHLENDDSPFYGNLGTTFADSFGFQFDVTIPSADLATTIVDVRMGTTDIYGTSPMFRLFLNDGTYKFGVFFNNNYDWTSYASSPVWTGDVTHLVEFYAIRTDSTHLVMLLGVDGELIWKTNAYDISEVDFSSHTYLSLQNKGTTKSKNYYSSAPTLEKALTRFARVKLHSEDIPTTNHHYTGACAGANGYYSKAKAFYNTYLTSTQKVEFATNAAYADMRERFSTWASFNGEVLTFDTTTGAIQISSRVVFNPIAINIESQSTLIVVIVAVLTASAIGLFFYIRRKQQD